jgi:hypothetical protein
MQEEQVEQEHEKINIHYDAWMKKVPCMAQNTRCHDANKKPVQCAIPKNAHQTFQYPNLTVIGIGIQL